MEVTFYPRPVLFFPVLVSAFHFLPCIFPLSLLSLLSLLLFLIFSFFFLPLPLPSFPSSVLLFSVSFFCSFHVFFTLSHPSFSLDSSHFVISAFLSLFLALPFPHFSRPFSFFSVSFFCFYLYIYFFSFPYSSPF